MTECEIRDCAKPPATKGWCPMHYQRWRRNGDPLVSRRGEKRPVEDRFWEKVDKNGPGGCWLWTSTITPQGYGQFMDRTNHYVRAHRWIYETLVGPIPAGLTLDHVAARGCTQKHCVNPAHLEAVTNRINILRGGNRCAINARKTHCPQGHPYDGSNGRVVVGKSGGRRVCRTCELNSSRRYKARKRAERKAAH